MIKVEKLGYSIPEKILYENISFEIKDGVHCALIGSNGTGKSTLIDMFLHTEDYVYDGKIIFSEGYKSSRIGYVSQFSSEEKKTDSTVFEYIAAPYVELNQRIETLCEKMATETDLDQIFEDYQKALDQKDSIDGDHYDSNIKKQLKLANLEKLENHKLYQLSGGEFKLVQVIKEMMQSPKMLIMDEPDVFLDFEHLNALKDLINTHKGTLLIITHNRYLLNHCFNKILHLENTDMQEYDGTYMDYNLELLTMKVELQEAAAKDQAEIERHQIIVDRIRAKATAMDNASLGRTVHARQTLLDRLEARKTVAPFIYSKRPDICFKLEEEVQDENILTLRDYEVSFEEQLLSDVDLEMKPEDKVAIIGKNGTGKTTLLHEIWKQEKSAITVSDQAKMQLFSQVTGTLFEEDKKLYQIFEEKGMERRSEIEQYLMSYGFEQDCIEKRVKELSGGEKDLLQMAVIALMDVNFLLLDEPTGHLDIYAQDSLEKAIREYKGAVLMVSHDFYIVANCMDYVLLVEDHTLRKMSIRKFRQMIYAKHFDKEYLLLEEKKKELEMRIEQLLQKNEFEKAKDLLNDLEAIITQMDKVRK